VRGRRARLDVVTMLESDSLDSDSSSVLLRLFVSLGSVVGVSAVALSCGSKSDLSCSSTFNINNLKTSKKFCSECGAESAPAGQWLPVAGGDRAWADRTGSEPMWMCGDIFAAARLWRGRLLTTGRLSCRHPVVV